MPESDQKLDNKRYQTTPRTLIFLFDQQNRVLLLKGAPSKRLWAGLFNGVGGHVECGEDILEAAERELFEETGIKNIDLRLCGQIMVAGTAGRGVSIFIFRGDYEQRVTFESSEGSLAWIDLDALLTHPIVEDLPIILPQVAKHQPGDPILIGKYEYEKGGKLIISFR